MFPPCSSVDDSVKTKLKLSRGYALQLHLQKFSATSDKRHSFTMVQAATTDMAALNDIVPVYQNLKREWTKTPCNLKKCGEILDQLKVEKQLVQLELLISDG